MLECTNFFLPFQQMSYFYIDRCLYLCQGEAPHFVASVLAAVTAMAAAAVVVETSTTATAVTRTATVEETDEMSFPPEFEDEEYIFENGEIVNFHGTLYVYENGDFHVFGEDFSFLDDPAFQLATQNLVIGDDGFIHIINDGVLLPHLELNSPDDEPSQRVIPSVELINEWETLMESLRGVDPVECPGCGETSTEFWDYRRRSCGHTTCFNCLMTDLEINQRFPDCYVCRQR